eukprot:CAMPEP_0114594084 /NCGR_PEP_ID=MMETSP0125-20121206/15704_1 /TAXON_ID=485358 ORGANISM="Aristerostoma sp., Strain ATCC 50986" /NCGR_SAMPLE_ID=MMETSP0125 /ASSEMBLY_ACC=CAM_ASM_000245 /LENGTH=69 /DNA_ID=CAMNT_0001793961 /DNA_START=169 /DNA_END=378 /DNA_ORIENTATION=+
MKKQNEFLQESKAVVPQVRTKLFESFNEMSSFLNEYGDDESIKEQVGEVKDLFGVVKEFIDEMPEEETA